MTDFIPHQTKFLLTTTAYKEKLLRSHHLLFMNLLHYNENKSDNPVKVAFQFSFFDRYLAVHFVVLENKTLDQSYDADTQPVNENRPWVTGIPDFFAVFWVQKRIYFERVWPSNVVLSRGRPG